MVAILLPFSALWASASIDQENSEFKVAFQASRQPLTDASNELARTTGSNSQLSQSRTLLSNGGSEHRGERKGSFAPSTSAGAVSRVEYVEEGRRDSTDAELKALGVRVNHSYGVESIHRHND